MRLTGSLWWVIGFHAALDWVQDFFYGTSNSGNVLLRALICSRLIQRGRPESAVARMDQRAA